MAEIITTVEDVKVVAEGVNSRGPWAKTAVVAGDGNEYATFDGALASKAAGFKGQTAKLTYESSQKGKYTNLDLKDIEAAAAGAAPVVSSGTDKSDQFRSKEELRYTAAMELAVTSFGVAGADPITDVPAVYELADEFYARLEQVGTAGGV